MCLFNRNIPQISPSVARALVLCLACQLLSGQSASMPMKYEGGSLAFDQHYGVRITLANPITVTQGEYWAAIAPEAITEISYGSDVHRRVGAAIGVALFTGGIGTMLLLVKTKKHYVGITWNGVDDQGVPARGGMVFKVGKGEVRGLIAALEGLTGKKAVNVGRDGAGGVLH